MIKADVIDHIATRAKLSHAQAKAALNAFMKATSDALKKGDYVRLEMFGTFKVDKRKQKIGTHPKTGAQIVIAARKVVKFSPSPSLGPNPKKNVHQKVNK